MYYAAPLPCCRAPAARPPSNPRRYSALAVACRSGPRTSGYTAAPHRGRRAAVCHLPLRRRRHLQLSPTAPRRNLYPLSVCKCRSGSGAAVAVTGAAGQFLVAQPPGADGPRRPTAAQPAAGAGAVDRLQGKKVRENLLADGVEASLQVVEKLVQPLLGDFFNQTLGSP